MQWLLLVCVVFSSMHSHSFIHDTLYIPLRVVSAWIEWMYGGIIADEKEQVPLVVVMYDFCLWCLFERRMLGTGSVANKQQRWFFDKCTTAEMVSDLRRENSSVKFLGMYSFSIQKLSTFFQKFYRQVFSPKVWIYVLMNSCKNRKQSLRKWPLLDRGHDFSIKKIFF